MTGNAGMICNYVSVGRVSDFTIANGGSLIVRDEEVPVFLSDCHLISYYIYRKTRSICLQLVNLLATCIVW